jgi:sortase A
LVIACDAIGKERGMVNRSGNGRLALSKVLWTLGNLMMTIGLFIVLYVGGLLADEIQHAYAANGGTALPSRPGPETTFEQAAVRERGVPDIASTAGRDGDTFRQLAGLDEPPVAVVPTQVFATQPTEGSSSAADRAPASEPEDVLSSVVPDREPRGEASTVTRIVIPAIKVDKQVVEVGWSVQQDTDGQAVAVWDVEKYRVGHHTGSSNPGGGSNIVLAGHSGGWIYPFNDLYYLKPGDEIRLYSAGQVYDYMVSEHILVDEVGQPAAKRRENARLIEPTAEEVVTMVACWPLSGPDKFSQRIIIRAKPASGTQTSG